MNRLGLWMTVVVAGFGSIAVGQQEPPREQSGRQPMKRYATRADLARAYLRFEWAYFSSTMSDEVRDKVNDAFDQASLAFFSGQSGEAIRALVSATNDVRGITNPSLSQRVAESVRVTIDPPVIVGVPNRDITVKIDSLFPAKTPDVDETVKKTSFTLEFVSMSSDGDGIGTGFTIPVDVPVTPGETVTHMSFSHHLDLRRAGRPLSSTYTVDLRWSTEAPAGVGTFTIAPRDLDAAREENMSAIAGAPKSGLAQRRAIRTFLARNALLTSKPSTAKSSQFLTDLVRLNGDLTRERSAILQGENPYAGKPGESWRVIMVGNDDPADNDAPVSPTCVYAPPAAKSGDPLPMIIALHGAGGDESMFMQGYGAGLIKELADKHGVLVVSPYNGPFSADPVFFDRVVEDIAQDYLVDRSRIYVIGHSMGGGVASAWAMKRADKIAACCTIAGVGSFGKNAKICPTLVIAAERDALMPINRARQSGQAMVDSGLPVTFQVAAHCGHTMAVGTKLPEVIPWLLTHRLGGAVQSPAPGGR